MSRISMFRWSQVVERQFRRSPKERRPELSHRPARSLPQLEVLEDRLTPSTLTVTSAADDGSNGTLRAVIGAASPGSTIVFDEALNGQTISLSLGQLSVNKSLDIEGPGARHLTISGNAASRVFDISNGATV